MRTSILRVALLAAILCVSWASPPALAQSPAFAVTPDALLLADGAPTLVRLYETEYDVESPGRAVTRVRFVMTAFSPAGRETVGTLRVVHGGFRHLRRFEGTLRDANGTVVRTLGRRDGEDRILGSLYEDLRLRSAELYGDAYPFTVEWSYEIEHRGVLGWPAWRPQPEGRPLEASSFTLRVPTGTLVRARTRDVTDGNVARDVRGRDLYTWRIERRGAVQPEPFGPPWWEQLPELRLGTDRFEIGGAPGRLDSWAEFGAWYGGLSDGRQRLPEAARAEVHRLIEGADTDREKARRLYRHLQETTRYVSIQLGLGGWQPFDAAYVFERRYGDCKALTNYMMALLAEAGVEAHPALIEAGEDGSDLDPEFPDNGFNHVILRVPMSEAAGPSMRTATLSTGDGAVWLECTSPYAAFGHLGSFTEGRPALLVTEHGGEIIHTPTSTAGNNRTVRTADVRLDASGKAEADVTWVLRGEPRADALAAMDGATAAERALVLRRITGLPSLDVLDLNLDHFTARSDDVSLEARLNVSHAARRAAGRLLVGLVPFASGAPALPVAEDRRQPVRLGHAYAERDSVRFVVPDGYRVHSVPSPTEVNGPVGRYTLQTTVEDGALVVIRELVVDAPRQPAETYAETRAFFDAVRRADAERAVLRTD